VTSDRKHKDLLKDEAAFWDAQEDAIDGVYRRPHDWRFVPEIAEILIGPRNRFLRSVFRRTSEVKSLLDIGCGSGWFCHAAAKAGVRCIGIDVSPRKIAAARDEAERLGVADRCAFHAMDVMDFEPEAKVDMLAAQGSLHHFPDLERRLDEMTRRFLREGGYLLFCEPNHQGMLPFIEKTVFRLARTRLFGGWFDKELYEEAHRPAPPDRAPAEAGADSGPGFNVRGESPSGLAFFEEEVHVGDVVKKRYALIQERFFLYFVGHTTNAGYVYMKPRWIRALVRWTLPLAVRLDTLLCRFRACRRKAEEGVWFLRYRPPA